MTIKKRNLMSETHQFTRSKLLDYTVYIRIVWMYCMGLVGTEKKWLGNRFLKTSWVSTCIVNNIDNLQLFNIHTCTWVLLCVIPKLIPLPTRCIHYMREMNCDEIIIRNDKCFKHKPADRRRKICSVSMEPAPWALAEPTCYKWRHCTWLASETVMQCS